MRRSDVVGAPVVGCVVNALPRSGVAAYQPEHPVHVDRLACGGVATTSGPDWDAELTPAKRRVLRAPKS